ncbi:carboxypeptidase regulatory-like domain-containing protein [Methanocalculus chunghsingensis]|nr:carboxypeptidase regulatory-like domain-containing protein [Methanocalculus chunghsingensis]
MSSLRFILALLLLMALAATAQGVVTLQITVEDTQGNLLSGADLYVGGSYIGTTGSAGTFAYIHSESSSFNLRVSKSGYETKTATISSSQTAVTVSLARSTAILTVEVYDENVAPLRNAIVRIVGPDQEKTGETSSDGRAVFTLNPGETYQIFISALNYRDVQRSVQFTEQTEPIRERMLRSDQFAFRITDAETGQPISGAEISIDNAVRGVTNADGTFLDYLRQGNQYDITVRKPEYQTYSTRQYISGDQQVLTITLQTAYHSPFVSVFDPDLRTVEGADIFLDGLLLRKTDVYGRASLNRLAAGTYLLEIRKSGFADYSEEITVSEDSLDFIINLRYTAVPARVVVEDPSHTIISDAVIAVNGGTGGMTGADGSLILSLTPGREYLLTVTKDGYHQTETTISIPAGTPPESFTVTLEPGLNLPLLVVGVVLIVIVILAGIILVRKRKGRSGSTSSGRRKGGW